MRKEQGHTLVDFGLNLLIVCLIITVGILIIGGIFGSGTDTSHPYYVYEAGRVILQCERIDPEINVAYNCIQKQNAGPLLEEYHLSNLDSWGK